MLQGYNLPGRQHIQFHNGHGILLSRIKLSDHARRPPAGPCARSWPAPGRPPERTAVDHAAAPCPEAGRCVPGTDTAGRPRAATGLKFSRNHAESRRGSDRYDASRC
jgi:hypothetical protein